MKGEIKMSAREIDRIQVMENLVRGEINGPQAANLIGVTARHVRRLKTKYIKHGPKGLVHQGRGRKSNRRMSSGEELKIAKIIETKYADFKPVLAHEKLSNLHGIDTSKETVRKIMIRHKIWTPRAGREKNKVHQMRPRRNCIGELVQLDSSPHRWFEDRREKCDLILFVDDAASNLMWAEFVESETTKAYMKAMKNYLMLHGKPLTLYTDKHSIFRVNTTRKYSVGIGDDNGLTQFGRAMKQLNIDHICAETAQAKGRVERAYETLQDRLVKEMRLKEISTIREGNRFLKKYLAEYNNKFGVAPASKAVVHRPLMPEENLDEILCIHEERVLSKNLEVQYKNKLYQIQVKPGYEYMLKKARVTVKEKLNGEIVIEYKKRNLDYKIHSKRDGAKIVASKNINKFVDGAKESQPKIFRFNLFGRTFLLC